MCFYAICCYENRKLDKVTELYDFLHANPYIPHFCGFEPFKPLPYSSVIQGFIKDIGKDCLEEIMQSQVLKLNELDFTNRLCISCYDTPIFANINQNYFKSLAINKFNKDNPPKSGPDCKLGVHTASEAHNE